MVHGFAGQDGLPVACSGHSSPFPISVPFVVVDGKPGCPRRYASRRQRRGGHSTTFRLSLHNVAMTTPHRCDDPYTTLWCSFVNVTMTLPQRCDGPSSTLR